jgi:hypothetical protein
MKKNWIGRSLAITAISAAVISPSSRVIAQESGDTSVVTVALAPIDTMLPNVQHLARLVAGGTGAGTVATILKQYTGGLDTSRPAGVFVDLDETGQPTPVAALPLKDIKEFFGQLAIFGEPEDLGDGLYQLNLGNSIYMRAAGDWLLVAQTEDAVMNFDTEANKTLKGLVAKYDIRVQVNPQNIPDDLVDFMMNQIEAGIEQGMAQQNADMDEAQEAAARKQAEQMMNSIQEAIEGTEKFVFGLAVNKAEKKTMLDFGTRFVADTKFAKQVDKIKSSKSALAGIPVEGSTLSGIVLQLIAPEEIAQMQSTIDASMQAALKQIDENSKDEASAKRAKEFISKFIDIVMESAKQGQMETALNVSTEKNLSIVAGVTVADAKKVEALAAEASKALADEGAPVNLQINTGKHAGANLHKLTAPLPPNADEKVRKIFGDNVTVAIATSPKAVHLAIGKDCDAAIKATLDRVAAKPSSPGEMMKARFSLGKLLQFVQTIESNPAVDAMIETTASGGDNIMVDSQAGDRQSLLRITLEDNVLKAISSGAKAAQGGGGF